MRIWIRPGLAVSTFTARTVCHARMFGGGDPAVGMRNGHGLQVP